jgi:D-3-phosphoglycerate dehydrogenase / 2-oxoglutarate reductase
VELDGKTLLIVGFGRIGRRVAELARAFGMNIIVYDPFIKSDDITVVVDLHEAFASADFISVHLPGGSGQTIGATELALMKSSTIIINAARGGIVDETALDAALRERRIRAAGIDVFVAEPPKPENPLLTNPYVTISPHNAGLTEECAMRMAIKFE